MYLHSRQTEPSSVPCVPNLINNLQQVLVPHDALVTPKLSQASIHAQP
jgi:hypothetical protein